MLFARRPRGRVVVRIFRHDVPDSPSVLMLETPGRGGTGVKSSSRLVGTSIPRVGPLA